MKNTVFFMSLGLAAVLACAPSGQVEAAFAPGGEIPETAAVATLAGGCFWCVESAFDGLDGVYAAVSGYTGGDKANPTYQEVSAGGTGHQESVQVYFDPNRIGYEQILDVFWRQIDPTDDGGQFADRGSQYRTSIFYHDDEQRRIAERSKQALAASGRFDRPIVTPIVPAKPFYEAEDYHQDYHLKHPEEYKRYRYGSGRTPFLERVWGPGDHASAATPDEDALRARLTPLQYHVVRESGTEPAFDNAYWDNKHEGIYVDIVSGEPLFSSRDKFASGTGWPSFTRPLVAANIVERVDTLFGVPRVEVRSAEADSHLGHVFPDGPAPTGMRYCINSAALRFIPREDLQAEGLGEFLKQFEESGAAHNAR